jgi:hypothetical protein
MKRTFEITATITIDDDATALKPRKKDVSRIVRMVLKHGRGYLPALKIVKLKTNETTGQVA